MSDNLIEKRREKIIEYYTVLFFNKTIEKN